MLCRRRILHFPPLSFNTRNVSRTFIRPAPRAILNPPTPIAHAQTRWRRYTSAAERRLAQEGFEMPIEPSEYQQIIARAKKVWPPPPAIPDGWSCTWQEWTYLLTFYWLSPYYLMLPQIEMFVNIRHRIPGETRPLLFSDERQSFVFTLVNSPKEFFLFDGAKEILYRVQGVQNGHALVQLMVKGYEALEAKLQAVPPDEEGEDALRRILQRDETVIPLLANKFLDYTPVPTTPWEEGTVSDDEMSELDFEKELEGLREHAEKEQRLREIEDGVDPLEQLPQKEMQEKDSLKVLEETKGNR